MIDKSGNFYTLSCDICGEEYPEHFSDFYDALEAKRDAGWKSRKTDEGWADVCDECLAREQEV